MLHVWLNICKQLVLVDSLIMRIRFIMEIQCFILYEFYLFDTLRTVMPVKSDSGVMFYLQSNQGLIIDRSLVY